MTELLVRVVDKGHDDPIIHALQSKRGEVIAIERDGWQWGSEELRRADWRIFIVPDLAAELAERLEVRLTLVLPQGGQASIAAYRLDLAHSSLDLGIAAFIADDQRAANRHRLAAATLEQIITAVEIPAALRPNS